MCSACGAGAFTVWAYAAWSAPRGWLGALIIACAGALHEGAFIIAYAGALHEGAFIIAYAGALHGQTQRERERERGRAPQLPSALAYILDGISLGARDFQFLG
jgi:hypothetical protein